MKLDDIDRADFPGGVRQVVEDRERLAAVTSLGSLAHGRDADFNRLTGLAADLFATPIAMVTLLDAERQMHKSALGVESPGMDVEKSFCAHTIARGTNDVMVVEDALADPRFAANPNVLGGIGIRFYAGAPIFLHGRPIGALCVIGDTPRLTPTDTQLRQLTDLAALASSLFALKYGVRRAADVDAALARAEERHALALSAASIASWVWDVRNETVECDPLLPILFGLPHATRLPVRAIVEAIDPRDAMVVEHGFGRALKTSDEYAGEFRVRDRDPARWLSGRGKVIERDADGRPTLVFGVIFDISENRLGQDRQRLLLRELNHRVKNTLATVQALATQTVRHSSEPKQFLEAFGGRLQALGLAHNLLSDHEWRGISLKQLIDMQVLPLTGGGRNRIVVAGEDTHISPDQAVALGMVLHELATNAVKHGSLSVGTGHVDLGWTLSRDEGGMRWLHLTWIESGGPPVIPPTRRGFGSILIEKSLGKVLSSRVEHRYDPGGVTATIVMTLED